LKHPMLTVYFAGTLSLWVILGIWRRAWVEGNELPRGTRVDGGLF
jgi:hypothetical protein